MPAASTGTSRYRRASPRAVTSGSHLRQSRLGALASLLSARRTIRQIRKERGSQFPPEDTRKDTGKDTEKDKASLVKMPLQMQVPRLRKSILKYFVDHQTWVSPALHAGTVNDVNSDDADNSEPPRPAVSSLVTY